MAGATHLERVYQKMLSDSTQKKSEEIILVIAIISFLVHLAIIYLVDFGIIDVGESTGLLKNPIAAIYTPFSFILVYEVYLLIYYLPKSITTYISKQYEIITLIIIRRLFKDLSSLTLSSDWFKIEYDLQFTYDLVASLLLFFLINLFYRQSRKVASSAEKDSHANQGVLRFIRIKKILATLLVPVVFGIAIYAFSSWLIGLAGLHEVPSSSFEKINNIFFEDFFNVLIIADVILLLFSFFYTDQFHKVIRNSGFIISTILIRISFSVEGLLNTVLIVTAMVFGLIILVIHNDFEKQLARENRSGV